MLIKRILDIIFSVLILLITLPLQIIISLLIIIETKDSVLFKQIRVGKNNKPFKMYKFRSMYKNDAENTAWSTKDDKRITKSGKITRKIHIDELPQLLNIIKGEMSLVGPRPEIPYYAEIFNNTIPGYALRTRVIPGITGLAQSKGYSGDTSIEKRAEYDNLYIDNWSIWLDIKIIWDTAIGIFKKVSV